MPIIGTPSSEDFNLEVRKGNIDDTSSVNILGHKYALGTAEVVIAELDAADNIDQSGLHTTPSQVKVSSSSANDKSGESGMRTMLLNGLDASGDAISETITMNGQTAVTSSLTYEAVLGMRALTWGATGWNEGTVYVGTGTVTTGKPAVILFGMGFDTPRNRGGNKALCAYYQVPNGKVFEGVALAATIGTSDKNVQIHIQTSTDGANWITEEVFEFESGSNVIKPIKALPSQPAHSHIRITGIASASGANVSAVLDGYLIDV